MAGIPAAANGTRHKNFSAPSTRSELHIQYNPAKKCPKPNHQPYQKDSFLFVEDSRIRKKRGKLMNKTGKNSKGAKAKTAIAPAKNKMNFFWVELSLFKKIFISPT